MFDLTTTKGKILTAAMKLAAEQPWSEVTLRDIALEAGLSMADLRREVSSKGHIFGLFTAAVDKEVLKKAGAPDPNQSKRDNVFETLMNRFDVLQPYKAAVKSILAASPPDPRLLQRLLSSQGWMLEAAGVSSYGPMGGLRTLGLASVYMQVARIWLDDDDPGMARTMAALDRRLRRGERTLQALDDGCAAVGRFAALLKPRQWTRRGKKPADDGADDADASTMTDVTPDSDSGTQPAAS